MRINLFRKKNKYQQLLSAIQQADSILLLTHVNPDGDALGTLLAAYLALQHFNKPIYPIILDSVKFDLNFLPAVEQLIRLENIPEHLDLKKVLAVAVDVADKDRLGTAKKLFFSVGQTAQFDHHGTNNAFANINYIDPNACSTAIMLYDFIKYNNIEITRDIASNIYAGIATDTGNFAFSNTNAHAFEAMVELSKLDFNMSELNYLLFRRKQLPQQKILGRALNTLTTFANDRAAYVYITKDDLLATGADNEHTTIIVNNVIEIEGIDIAFFIHEGKDERVRCSFRSKKGYRVDGIASHFGGGGHIYASGTTINMPMEKAIPMICQIIEKELNQ